MIYYKCRKRKTTTSALKLPLYNNNDWQRKIVSNVFYTIGFIYIIHVIKLLIKIWCDNLSALIDFI